MDISTLGIKIDSSEVVDADKKLDKLTTTSEKVEAVVKKVGPAFTAAGQKIKEAADGATARVRKLVDDLGGAEVAGKAVGAGIAAGITSAVAGLAALDRIINSIGEWQDLAEKTGASASGLASMKTAMDVAGMSSDTMASSIAILTRNLAGVDDEGKGAGKALAAIGLSLDDIEKMRPDEQMRSIATAMAGFEDSASKAAVAQAIFGRGGAEMLPLLKELGAETGVLTGLTDEQIAAADEYADSNARMRSQLAQTMQFMASEATPVMTGFMGAVQDTITEMFNLGGESTKLGKNTAVRDFAVAAARAMGFVIDAVDGVVRIFQHVGNRLGGIAAAAVAVSQGEFAMAGRIMEDMRSKQEEIWNRGTFSAKLEARLADIGKNEASITSTESGAQKLRELNFKTHSEKQNETAKKAAAEAKRLATEAERDRKKENDARIKAGREWAIEQGDRVTKENEAYQKMLEEQAKEQEKIKEQLADQQRDALVAVEKQVIATNTQVKQHGMLESAIAEVTLARLEDARTGAALAGEDIGYIDQRIDAQRRLIEALKGKEVHDANVKSAEDAQKTWEKSWDQVGQSLTDQLMEGGRNAKEYLENLFRTMVLRPAIQAGVNLGMSAFGLGGGAPSSGALSGIGSLLGGGNGIGSLLTSAGGGILNAAMGVGVPVAPGIGMAAGGLSGAAGSAMGALAAIPGWGWAAAAVAAVLASGAFKGETRHGGHYGMGRTNAGQYGPEASFIHGPSGGQILNPSSLQGTATGINSLLERLGSSQRLAGLYGGLEASKNDRGGVYSGGYLTGGAQFGELGLGGGRSNYKGTLYETSSPFSGDAETMAKLFATDLKQVTIQALQAAAGEFPVMIREMLHGVDAEAMTDEAASALLARIESVTNSANLLTAAFKQMRLENLRDVSFEAAAALADLAGSAEAMIGLTSNFQNKFYSEAERRDQTWKNLVGSFQEMGLVLPSTREGFRDLVNGFDENTEAGRRNLVRVLQLTDAFDFLYPAVEKATDAITDAGDKLAEYEDRVAEARSNLQDAYERERSELEKTASSMEALGKSLKGWRDNLVMGQLSPLTPAQRYAEAQSRYDELRGRASTGDVGAIEAFPAAAEQLLEASRTMHASGSKYQQDFIRVLEDAEGMQTIAELEYQNSRLELQALEASVAGLIEVRTATLSVRDAIIQLHTLLANGNVSGTPADTADPITRAYRELLGRDPEAGGYGYYQGLMAMGVTEAEIRRSIANSPEYAQRGLPQLAGGMWRVPSTGVVAQLHPDEAVLPAPDARSYRAGNSTALASQVGRLAQAVEALRRENREDAGNTISATYDATHRAARITAKAAVEAAMTTAYVAKKKPVLS